MPVQALYKESAISQTTAGLDIDFIKSVPGNLSVPCVYMCVYMHACMYTHACMYGFIHVVFLSVYYEVVNDWQMVAQPARNDFDGGHGPILRAFGPDVPKVDYSRGPVSEYRLLLRRN